MLVVLSVLLMLISCGKGENKENGVEKIFNNGKSDSKTSGNEIKKYNDYVNIYNRVLNIDKDFIDYFKDAGNQEQLKKDESPGTGFKTLNQDFINQIKEQAKKAPAMEIIRSDKIRIRVVSQPNILISASAGMAKAKAKPTKTAMAAALRVLDFIIMCCQVIFE